MQDKLVAQIPLDDERDRELATGFPNTHIAVISSDLGAPGDSVAKIGCTPRRRLRGRSRPSRAAACKDSTLTAGATFVSDAHGVINYTAANIADVVQCILPLGESGCSSCIRSPRSPTRSGPTARRSPTATPSFCAPTRCWPSSSSPTRTTALPHRPSRRSIRSTAGPNNLTNSRGPLDHLPVQRVRPPLPRSPAATIRPPSTHLPSRRRTTRKGLPPRRCSTSSSASPTRWAGC